MRIDRKMTIKMAYEVIILGHLHMPLYFLGTFTEYPFHRFSNLRPAYKQVSYLPKPLNHISLFSILIIMYQNLR